MNRWLPVAMLTLLAALALPSAVQAQVGTCFECDLHDFGDGQGYQEVCFGQYSGYSNCAQAQGAFLTACNGYGEPDCEIEVRLDGSVGKIDGSGLSVHAAALLGEVTDGYVRRVCDGAVVARLLTPHQRREWRASAKKVVI